MSQTTVPGQLADVDVRLLRVFRTVADSGGMAAAELELNIGRSTISRHIKELETRLGMVLCRRGRGGFALTVEGKRIYDATMRLLGAMDDFRNAVGDIHETLTGTFSLALFDKTTTHDSCRIWAAIERFDALAPAVTLEAYVEPLNEIERNVMDGRFDLGIIPEHRRSASLLYRRLYSERMYLYCSEQHELFDRTCGDIRREDILRCKYAGLGYHSPNMEVSRQLGIERSASGYDQEAVLTLILSGRYIGYLPDHYAQWFVNLNRIRPIMPESFFYECFFSSIVRRSPKPSRAVELFATLLTETHDLVES